MKKLLYVDDEKINLKIFTALFRKKYDVFVAESGPKALPILQEHTDIDYVISDMKMPEMDGLEFIRKASENHPSINYYILSGFYQDDKITKAIEEGLILEFFEKPFDIDQIQEALEKTGRYSL